MTDPTTVMIAENLLRMRKERRLSLRATEHLTGKTGWRISRRGLRRIELRERQVTVKDLMVLASALNVTPLDLMLPPPGSGSWEITGLGEIDADEAWTWMTGGIGG